MTKSGGPPHLTVIGPGLSGPQPSRPLGEHGQALWGKVTREYAIEDAAGIETLTQCCQAVDLAEALSARIAEDGEIIRTMNGIKAHPAIKDGLAARGFVVRTLRKLGLNFEPLRTAPGRPWRNSLRRCCCGRASRFPGQYRRILRASDRQNDARRTVSRSCRNGSPRRSGSGFPWRRSG
jgi:hypothetical protein